MRSRGPPLRSERSLLTAVCSHQVSVGAPCRSPRPGYPLRARSDGVEEQGKEEKDNGEWRQEEDEQCQSEEHDSGGPQNNGDHVPNEFEDLIEEVNRAVLRRLAMVALLAPREARRGSLTSARRSPARLPRARGGAWAEPRPAFSIRYRASVLGEDVVNLRISTRLDKGVLKAWRERMTNEVSGPAAPK